MCFCVRVYCEYWPCILRCTYVNVPSLGYSGHRRYSPRIDRYSMFFWRSCSRVCCFHPSSPTRCSPPFISRSEFSNRMCFLVISPPSPAQSSLRLVSLNLGLSLCEKQPLTKFRFNQESSYGFHCCAVFRSSS